MKRLLLVSNATLHGSGYLDHCEAEMKSFLGRDVKRVLFVPFALRDRDAYAEKARARLGAMGFVVESLHKATNRGGMRPVLEEAEALFIGGGNTFRLLRDLHTHALIEAIRRRVEVDLPYMGSSAGSNVACVSIKTTNDMPIVYPPSLDALALVPFNINPHYQDPVAGSTHMGETREERIREFHEENDPPVVGLREGAMLRVEGGEVRLLGTTGARVFRKGREPEEFLPPARLDFLMA